MHTCKITGVINSTLSNISIIAVTHQRFRLNIIMVCQFQVHATINIFTTEAIIRATIRQVFPDKVFLDLPFNQDCIQL